MSTYFHLLIGAMTTPSNLLALLVVVGGFLLAVTRRRRGFVLVMAGALFLVAICVGPLSSALLLPLENRFPPPALPQQVHGIVVLGGSISTRISRMRGRPAITIAPERLFAAAALARQYPEARIIVAGGIVIPEHGAQPEASYMRDALIALGVQEGRLELENRSRNTCENAVFSHALAAPKEQETWLLVTSAFHMPRAVGCFRKAGWAVLPYPVDYLTTGRLVWFEDFELSRHLRRLDIAAHEWVGLLGYAILGWTDEVLPGPQ